MRVRGNQQIWRVAEYIYMGIYPPWEGRDYLSWDETAGSFKEQMYDNAAELLRKLQGNEFTQEDNHGD